MGLAWFHWIMALYPWTPPAINGRCYVSILWQFTPMNGVVNERKCEWAMRQPTGWRARVSTK